MLICTSEFHTNNSFQIFCHCMINLVCNKLSAVCVYCKFSFIVLKLAVPYTGHNTVMCPGHVVQPNVRRIQVAAEYS